jgi:5,10-methylenetetrahydrofolate reductase
MTKLTEILDKKGSLLSTEFVPPKTVNMSELVSKTLKVANLIDSVSVPELKANDRNIPKHRMNAFYTALRLRDLTGVETLFHLTPRDINKNAVAGLLLAAAEANLQNVLAIGGDRYSPTEERTLSRNVYDFAGSADLIKGIRSLEAEVSLGKFDGFCIVVGTDPTVIYTNDKEKIMSEVTKLIDRQEAGAEMVQTQPVFDIRFFEFLDIAREHGLKLPVLVGILPLRGKTDAVEIERRYGITIPLEVKSTLRERDEETGNRSAFELASRLVKNGVRTIHVYPREDCNFLINLAKSAFNSVSFNLNEQ